MDAQTQAKVREMMTYWTNELIRQDAIPAIMIFGPAEGSQNRNMGLLALGNMTPGLIRRCLAETLADVLDQEGELLFVNKAGSAPSPDAN